MSIEKLRDFLQVGVVILCFPGENYAKYFKVRIQQRDGLNDVLDK